MQEEGNNYPLRNLQIRRGPFVFPPVTPTTSVSKRACALTRQVQEEKDGKRDRVTLFSIQLWSTTPIQRLQGFRLSVF